MMLVMAVTAVLSHPAVQALQGPSPEVTFKTEVNYIDVDVAVSDKQGQVVSDLVKDDFQVLEDGKPQRIETFSYVDLPIESPVRQSFMNRPVYLDVKNNAQATAGRLYVIVLDDLGTSIFRTASVKQAARLFVERYMSAHDVAAIVCTSGRADVTQMFTDDSRLLLGAIEKFEGQKLRSGAFDAIDRSFEMAGLDLSAGASNVSSDEQSERAHRALRVLDNLARIVDFMSNVRGRRKALVLLSEGIDYPMDDIFTAPRASDVQLSIRDVVRAAARANVVLYGIDPRGLVGMTSEEIEIGAFPETSPSRDPLTSGAVNPLDLRAFADEMRVSQNSLRWLADETGGFAVLNTNTFDGAFDRIVRANSSYYVLGYYPPTHPRDGKFHKIEVRVKRPDATVFSRKGYVDPKGPLPKNDASAVSSSLPSPNLLAVMSSPMQQGGVTMTAQASAFRGASVGSTSVALALEVDINQMHFTPTLSTDKQTTTYNDDVEVSYISVNQEGKQFATRNELTLRLRPESYDVMRQRGMRSNSRLALVPGRYQVRIGVRDSGGAVGTIFYDLDVPDFSKPALSMSGLLLSVSSAPATPTVLQDKTVSADQLPWPATTQRVFTRTDTLAMYSEIYDAISNSVPHRLDVTTSLYANDGRQVFVAHDSFEAGGRSAATTYTHAKQIPLSDIGPGLYLLRVEAAPTAQLKGAAPVKQEAFITIASR